MQFIPGQQKEKNQGVDLTEHPKQWSNYTILFSALFLLGMPYSLLAFTGPTSNDTPESIIVEGKNISLKTIKNPFSPDPDTIKEGGQIYIKNCFLCHGDLLDGKGLFGKSFIPAPANFLQKKSITSKTPAYAFWRIMKGGKGLPEKFEPWNSAMPAWEDFLTEDEIWAVILFMYEQAGHEPRTWEEEGEEH